MTYEYHCNKCYKRHRSAEPCVFTENLNITPKRLKALELIAGSKDAKGLIVGYIAQELLTGDYKQQTGRGLWPQQATRSGAGYVIPLVKAGLLRVWPESIGWGTVSITDAGRKVLAAHKAANDPANMPLEAVIARAVDHG
jgi:hypothetical protein